MLKKKRKFQTTSLQSLTSYPIGKLESQVRGVCVWVEVKQHWTRDGERGQAVLPTQESLKAWKTSCNPWWWHAVVDTASRYCGVSCSGQGTTKSNINNNQKQCKYDHTKMWERFMQFTQKLKSAIILISHYLTQFPEGYSHPSDKVSTGMRKQVDLHKR